MKEKFDGIRSRKDSQLGDLGYDYSRRCILDRGIFNCVINDETGHTNVKSSFFHMNPRSIQMIKMVASVFDGTVVNAYWHRKADTARNFSATASLASTSNTGIPVLMDVTNEQTIDISIGSATELRDLNISRSEAMQNHWRSADKRCKTVFEANPFGLSCSVCD
ncbi:uncharacterized protein TNCV_4192611 [Trichonephila clavipes]|nr:uncharacterized protein TNCV_4192611 [Trichonephila clavipes]